MAVQRRPHGRWAAGQAGQAAPAGGPQAAGQGRQRQGQQGQQAVPAAPQGPQPSRAGSLSRNWEQIVKTITVAVLLVVGLVFLTPELRILPDEKIAYVFSRGSILIGIFLVGSIWMKKPS